MCGRYGRRSDKQYIAEHYRLGDLRDVPLEAAPDWNITPDSVQPVIRLSKDSGERELAFLKWRLVPFWSKTPKPPFESINARADNLLTSSAWREPFQRRHCLIPGEFFYEWEQIDKKRKQPYAVALKDDRLFSFGGVWDRWKDHDRGHIIESFAMITCDPNGTMEAFHDRTPLVIEPSDYDRWLADVEPSQLPIDLVRTYPAEGMKAWKIAKLIGNGPHLLDPLPEAPPPALMLF
ncbi:SOS response-associated peptidase [Granulicella arctica]|uniref:SOS response-associated peptidase n=1 Tax=Granulicella arctica TaxID=940613 RepID=UPI0021E0F663|nr:SOS response-associated peptidase [Granulicella arctica]